MEMIFLYIALLLFMAGAIVSAVTSRHRELTSWTSLGFVCVASACLLYLAIYVFVKGAIESIRIFSLESVIGASFTVGVDSLSALFLLIISIISFCTALFSIRYIRRYERESLLRYYPLLLLFFSSITGVVCITDMLFFITFWEMMTLTSYALIVYERESKTSLKAGLIYFVITHIATLCGILIASTLLYFKSPEPHSFGFDAFRVSFETLLATNPALVHLILALYFIGFVTKAGMLPFGFWLPLAHPAPSSFSAVLSGVMIKAGIYGIVRLFGTILPLSSPSQAWGVVIAIFGTISIFVGTMSALTQDDSKILMAFHSIGQIGYMLLGIGTGLYFLPVNPGLAIIALVAGLFHMINHSWFKSCLFLNAGSILYKTGIRDLNKFGGLFNLMPWTGITALIASLAISGIPPLNGFASKLLIFESSIMAGTQGAMIWAKGLFVILGIAAIFISAVTLASFLKFLNSAFMGKLRGVEVSSMSDVPLSMRIPQGILAFLCVLFGIVPLLPITIVYKAISGALPLEICPTSASLFSKVWPGISIDFGMGMISGVWNPLWIIVAFAILLGLIYLVVRTGGAKVREVETWYGGKEHIAEEISYRGHSFYMPFKEAFSFRARDIEFQGLYPSSFPLPKITMPKGLRILLHPDQWFYYPITSLFMKFNRGFSRSHTGHPQLYLLWVALGVILVIIILLCLSKG